MLSKSPDHVARKGLPPAARILRAVSGVLPLILALSASWAMPTAGASGPQAASLGSPVPDGLAGSLLEVAAGAARVMERMDEIWPGFSWPGDKDFLVYHPDGAALLVSRHSPPAGFRPLEGPSVPPGLRGRAYLYVGALPGDTAQLHEDRYDANYPVGGREALAVVLDPADPLEAVALAFGVAFGQYQQGRFAEPVYQASAPEVGDFHKIAALAEVERRILVEALALPAPCLPDALQEYLAVRHLRTGSTAPGFAAAERRLERTWGSIRLAGHHAVAIATGGDAGQLAESIIRGLGTSILDTAIPYIRATVINVYLAATLAEEPIDRDGLKGYVAGAIAGLSLGHRIQETGAAIGYLLDRLGAGGWRSKLEEGATFEALLQEAAAFDPGAAAPRLPGILGRYGYEGILAAVAAADVDTILEAAAEASRRGDIQSVEDFYALAPIRLTWETTGRPGDHFNLDYSEPGADGGLPEIPVLVRLEPGLFAFPTAGSLVATMPQRWLEVRGLGVLFDARQREEDRTLRFTVLLADWPAINGGGLPPGRERFEQVRVEADGLFLAIDEPVWVQVRGQEVLVTPAEGD